MDDLYRIDSNPYKKDILSLYKIKKILREDGDTNKKFKDEIYGYKLYRLNEEFGNKYYNRSRSIARIITKQNHESRYYVIVKVRAKMPVLCPRAEKFIFTKDELDELMNTYRDTTNMPKLRTMCLVNESIVNFDTGMEIKKFPPGFKKELKLYAPVYSTSYYGNYDSYTKLQKYVFPNYFKINSIECDHGLYFFISIKHVLEFFDNIRHSI